MKRALSLLMCMLLVGGAIGSGSFAEIIDEAYDLQEAVIEEIDEIESDIPEIGDEEELIAIAEIEEQTEASEADLLDDHIIGNVVWSIDDKTLTFSGTGAMPAYSQGNAPWNAYQNKVTNIIISDGITSVSNYAFYEFTKLKTVSLPSSLTSIGSYAFAECEFLKSITLPKGLTYIGPYAFHYTDIRSITIPGGVKTISEGAFYGTAMLSACTIEEGVQTIGKKAFRSAGFTRITIPKSVRRLEAEAFWQADILSIVFKGDLDYIGAEALDAASYLKLYAPKGSYILRYFETTQLMGVAIPVGSSPIIALDKNLSAAVYMGERWQVVPGYDSIVSCKSSKKSVATIDADGFITTVAPGQTVITVKLDTGKSRTLTLTVRDPLKAVSVSMNRTGTVRLYLNDTMKLQASMQPASAVGDLKWKSSDTRIAAVVDGVVTPVKEGTVTITVTTPTKKTASVKVQVADRYKATAVELDHTGTVELREGSTLQLKAKMAPTNTTSTITWTSSAPKVASVTPDGLVTFIKSGTATISAKTSSGKKAAVKVKVRKVQELYPYFDKPVSSLIKAFKMKYKTWSGVSEYHGYAWKSGLEAWFGKSTKTKPGMIRLTKQGYSIYGVEPGMTKAELMSVLSARGGVIDDYGAQIFYMPPKSYPQWEISTTYWMDNGVVESIEWGEG